MSNARAGPFLNFLALHNERKLENPEKFERLRTTFWPFAVAGGFLFGLGIAGGNAFMSGMGVRVRSRSRCEQQRDVFCLSTPLQSACQHPTGEQSNPDGHPKTCTGTCITLTTHALHVRTQEKLTKRRWRQQMKLPNPTAG